MTAQSAEPEFNQFSRDRPTSYIERIHAFELSWPRPSVVNEALHPGGPLGRWGKLKATAAEDGRDDPIGATSPTASLLAFVAAESGTSHRLSGKD